MYLAATKKEAIGSIIISTDLCNTVALSSEVGCPVRRSRYGHTAGRIGGEGERD